MPTFIRLGLKKMGIRVVQKKVERIVGGLVASIWMPDWNDWMSDWNSWHGGESGNDIDLDMIYVEGGNDGLVPAS